VAAYSGEGSNDEKINKIRPILASIPKLNIECLRIVFGILDRVAKAQEKVLKATSKASSLLSLSRIFSAILLNSLNESPVDDINYIASRIESGSQLISFMIQNRGRIFCLLHSSTQT